VSLSDQNKWDRIYRDRAGVGSPSPVLTSLANDLPHRGNALDLAGGAGRHALWLASLGLDVTLADVSEVALAMASAEAQARALSLRTLHLDVDVASLGGPWKLILCFHFLDRRVLAKVADHLALDGVFAMVHPTRRNLERHTSPSERFLLEEGELATLLPDLQIVHSEESWSSEDRHEAQIVARKIR
jgi:tellurite methyltransferase